MKKLYFLFAVVLFFVSGKAQIINFPDANFKARLMQSGINSFVAQGQLGNNILIDSNGDNEIDVAEAEVVYTLNLQDASIFELEGLNFFVNLRYLSIGYNHFSVLDVSSLPFLQNLSAGNCQNLTYINIKNGLLSFFSPLLPPDGVTLPGADFPYCPNLQYVCCDDDEFDNGLAYLSFFGYTNVSLSSYCSFTPGGTFYSIEGISKYDFDNDGCTQTDIVLPHINFSIANGTVSGNLFANQTGSYFIPVQAGSHTVTPIIENGSYFTISPTNVTVNFPSEVSPFIQNFCVAPNGVHRDLEVVILPVGSARPGFDVRYRIVIRNKGNQLQSGSIDFSYQDAVLDFVTANPNFVMQTQNSLIFDFEELLPFATKEIVVTFNLNSPVEIPSVNGGDILNFTASILSAQTDETPSDNTFTLNQTVVNSFDPNDKTCLQGNTITPEMVGKDVHYLIRFENTGTANAENVVVKDMIDISKFDINSLIPMDGSHPFVTRISNTNKVEFIFENINLPFDDANNDGYVAFKIKTKPTLVLGDSFSNTASIYFDYNFPIITDPAITTVALLGNSDFAFDNYFSIYPNPANNVLNIETKKTIDVTSISIYNTLGQVILVIPNAQQTKSVDVSSLKTGNYFLKINSDKGSSSVKFVKM